VQVFRVFQVPRHLDSGRDGQNTLSAFIHVDHASMFATNKSDL